MSNLTYSERETRLIIAWMMITFGIIRLLDWSILTTGIIRPAYIIDLALPAVLAIVGVYILRKKIPEK